MTMRHDNVAFGRNRFAWLRQCALAGLMLLPIAGHTALGASQNQPVTTVELWRGFGEMLVPTGAHERDEDVALHDAITAYQARAEIDDFSALENFLAAHPHSSWRLGVLTNLGLASYQYGYFDRAIGWFEQAWTEGRSASDPAAQALADRAAGELLKMHARLGHAERLTALLADMHDRDLRGAASELRDGAKEGLWTMRNRPGLAYLCGPAALRNMLIARGAKPTEVAFLEDYRSGPHGVTLAQVGHLADQAGLAHSLIRRTTDQDVPVPSIIHWKVNHFAAIVAERNGRYHLQDPTFGTDLWVTRRAIDSEGSGYFLVPNPKPGTAWHAVGETEAGRVFGMGQTHQNNPNAVTPADTNAQSNSGNGNCGLCGYSFKEMTVSLNLSDTPLSYVPPIGPAVPVTVSYNQREAGQPANFTSFNVSQQWSLNWMGSVTDDPAMPGMNVVRNVGGGGEVSEPGYSPSTGSFTPESYDNSVLTQTGSASYTRSLPDGSVETYGLSNGATSFPRQIFLTAITDPQGNSVTLQYDASFRLTTVTDATGLQTTFLYQNTSFPLQVTQVTDPFHRSARLGYDGQGRLHSLTDAVGNQATFTYSGSLITALATPYGTTSFSGGDNGNTRYLQATDPLGYTERLEFNQSAPGIASTDPAATVPSGIAPIKNDYLQDRDTFYWDKHAYAVAAGNYAQARIRHWAHELTDPSVTSDFLQSEKPALENRIWYVYEGQPDGLTAGTLNKPTGIARVLSDGSSQVTQYTYNALGNVTLRVDPVGRQTVFNYASNQIDVVNVQQHQGSGFVQIASFTYDAHHRPLTATDAAGQTTQYSYNSLEQLTKMVNPLGQATQYHYDAKSRLASVTNADGVKALTLTYGAGNLVASSTDSQGYTLAYIYDNLNRLTQQTFPDSSTRTYQYSVLDLQTVTDRQGRTTTYTHDADRNLTAVADPLGNTTKFGYYENGVRSSLTDADGNLTQWAIDVESRVTGKKYADGSVVAYAYDPATSRLASVTDALQQVKTFGYTEDDRVASLSYSNTVNPTPNVTFSYLQPFPLLGSMTDGNGTTTYQYNAVGKLGALQVSTETPPFANSQIASTYDQLGRLSQRSVGGDTESFGYDKIGRLVTHVGDLGSFALGYLGETGQLTSRGNGTVGTAWTYDTNQNDRKLIGVATTPNASSYSFTNAPEGDITQIVDAYNQQTLVNSYDADDQLLKVNVGGRLFYGYQYDAANNLTSFTGRPGHAATEAPNSLNQLATFNSTAFRYDADGNLLQDATRAYSWDAENRLIGISYLNNASEVDGFAYDGLGRRTAIGQTISGVSSATHYGWCGSTLCQSRSGADAPIRRYLAEGEETPAQNQNLYYGVDQLGSVRDALDATSGASAQHNDYGAFGIPLGATVASATDYRFAGLFLHQSSGLYLSATRAYDPATGHWLSRDPISEAGGINLYAYVQNNPFDAVDPLGLCGQSAFGRALSALENNPLLLLSVLGTEIIGGGPEDPLADAAAGAEIYAAEEAGAASEDAITLYRGVDSAHPGYADALRGVANPRGGDASLIEHVLGNTESPYVSLTSDYGVAEGFATRQSGSGSILTTTVPRSAVIPSPGNAFGLGESEFLLRGPVTGAQVTPVP